MQARSKKEYKENVKIEYKLYIWVKNKLEPDEALKKRTAGNDFQHTYTQHKIGSLECFPRWYDTQGSLIHKFIFIS